MGVKCEFKRNLGRLSLFYGNKTTIPLQVNFSILVLNINFYLSSHLFFQNFTTVLSSPHLWVTKLAVQIKPIEPILEAGAQIQQLVIIECIEEYTGNVLYF